jgi:hypothetical protein
LLLRAAQRFGFQTTAAPGEQARWMPQDLGSQPEGNAGSQQAWRGRVTDVANLEETGSPDF